MRIYRIPTSPRRCRRPARRIAAALLTAGTLFAGCGPGAKREVPEVAKNAILVCIDTLRADHVGAYGYFRETTPRIDRLAEEGVLFERAQAHSNWTVPATASLLTSLYPSEHGAVIESELKHLGETPPSQLRQGAETLGDVFQRYGLRTGLFSANPFLFGRFKRGFDVTEVEWQSAESLTDKTIAWLEERPAEPFFVHLQYMDLHHPIDPPEPYYNYFEVEVAGPRGPEHEGWAFGSLEDPESPLFQQFRAHKIAIYDGALRYVDAQIGRLVDTLAELGVAETTLLVITSDHGEEFWDHAEIERRLATDPRGLWGVGHGHSMFQELLRTPLIFSGPGVAAGTRVDCEARHLDVAPTVLDLLGLTSPPQMRGIRLAPYWRSDAERRDCEPLPQIAESPAYGPEARALIWKRRKLIRFGDGRELLFDLRSDPGETKDLSGEQPELTTALGEMIATELSKSAGPIDDPGESREMGYDAETERQLRALGYLD